MAPAGRIGSVLIHRYGWCAGAGLSAHPTLPAHPAFAARSALALLLSAIVAGACGGPKPPDPSDCAGRIAAARAAKDAQFLAESDVVPENRKADLLPLEYYPIDCVAYSVPAALKVSNETGTIMMPTSAGTQDEMRRVGTLEFVLNGEQLKLTAFVSAADRTMDRLFVPFRDLTAGTETYAAGRYLDLVRTATGLYEIDFNVAYNPNCYFNPTWICPLPPRENHLPVRIEAGERVKIDTAKKS
jgi:uncharacterized protein (DUF1684 family)